jgi:hypothetical protein
LALQLGLVLALHPILLHSVNLAAQQITLLVNRLQLDLAPLLNLKLMHLAHLLLPQTHLVKLVPRNQQALVEVDSVPILKLQPQYQHSGNKTSQNLDLTLVEEASSHQLLVVVLVRLHSHHHFNSDNRPHHQHLVARLDFNLVEVEMYHSFLPQTKPSHLQEDLLPSQSLEEVLKAVDNNKSCDIAFMDIVF